MTSNKQSTSDDGKLVQFTFPSGKPCMAPAKFKGCTSKTRLFVAMLRDGYTPYKIASITNLKFQQVRGQLVTAGVWKDREAILAEAAKKNSK